MSAPKFIAGRQAATVLSAMQLCYLFTFNDQLYTWRPSDGVSCLALFAVLELAITLALRLNLLSTARARGYGSGWASLAFLSMIGVLVVYLLPDRTSRPAQGFPIQPMKDAP